MLCPCLTSSQRLGSASSCLAAVLVMWALLVVWAGALKSSHFLKISFVSPLPMSCHSLTRPYPISQQKVQEVIQINSRTLTACRSREGDLNVGLSDSHLVVFFQACEMHKKGTRIDRYCQNTVSFHQKLCLSIHCGG